MESLKTHIKLLKEYPACVESIEFASQYDTMVETIANCDNIDWLRWALRLLPVKERVRHACYIVRDTPTETGTAWDLLADERSRNAIETAERWADGQAADKELADAAADAGAATGYADAVTDAAYAAAAACAAAADAGAATGYADAVTDAAYAAACTADTANAPTTAANAWQAQYIKSIDWSFCDE